MDRKKLDLWGTLYCEIKRRLCSGKKDDPSTRIDVRMDQDDQDAFNEGLALVGKPKQERGKSIYRIYSNKDLISVLGNKWDERILNVNGDFAFVIEGTVSFWLTKKYPIEEFKVIGGKYIRSEIEESLCLILARLFNEYMLFLKTLIILFPTKTPRILIHQELFLLFSQLHYPLSLQYVFPQS